MFDQLKANLLRRVDIPEIQLDTFCQALQVRQIRKRKAILLEGVVEAFVLYVNKGLFRMYTTDEQDNELTFDFAAEDTWAADLNSFRYRLPSRVTIEAIEDSEAFFLFYEDVVRLHEQIPQLERFSRYHAEEKYIEAMIRLQKINHPNFTVEERYLAFLDTYPHLANRIPSMHLASFLGVAPETLSRVRKAMQQG